MASAEQYADWIVKNADKKGSREFAIVSAAYKAMRGQPKEPDAFDRETMNFAADMPWYQQAAAGVGKAITDVGRGVGQMVGAVSRDDVKESRRLDAPLMKTGAGTAGNIAGNVALLAPAALLPGANVIAGGAALGAGLGLLQPSESTSETLGNVGLGAVGGAAVPTLVRGWQAGRALAEPFYESGKNAILGRALNAAAGRDAPAVASRLREAAQPFVGPSQGAQRATMGELVPGSVPTVGQAAGNAGVAAMERSAVATNPEVTNAISTLAREQNAARVGLLDDMAGNDGRRQFFTAARDATADQMYGAARRLGVDPAVLTPDVLANIAKFSQRIPDEVIGKARQLAKISGEELTDSTSVHGMHWMKMAIDDLIGAAKRSGNGTLERAYVGLQKDLLTGLDNLSPAYAAARGTYAEMSKPINQMQVAESLLQKSVDPLTGAIRPSNYARALNDKTAASATGLPSATLEGTMTNAQTNALNSLLLDVQRSNAAQNVGRGSGSDTVQKLAYTNMLEQSGVPTFLRDFAPAQVAGNVLARAGDAAYGRANRELSMRLAEVMLDPGQAAALMQRASPAQRNAIAALLERAGSGLALSAPTAANGSK